MKQKVPGTMIHFQFSCPFRKLKTQFKRYCEEALRASLTAQALKDET